VVIDGFVTWLVEGGAGPALVALPVNLAVAEAAGSARRWFRRVRRTDDLGRLVKAATGVTLELPAGEFSALRRLLEDPHTWVVAGRGTVDDLTDLIASALSLGAGETAADLHAAAATIARGLLEFTVADLDPALFQELLLARLQRMENGQASALDKLLFELQAELVVGFSGMMDQFSRVLERLPPEPAGRGEVAVYLTALIAWLNTDPWPRDRRFNGPVLTPAAMERKLRVASVDQAEEHDLDADVLAGQCQRLVILGEPGSGKTWLARRIARRCAEGALEALTRGESLAEVELPLFTTCSRLFAAKGDIRTAAVSSAFDQFPDLGSARISSALRLFFTERNSRTLLVIDSLDEAVGSDERLRQADTLPWRIVLTSRRSSWDKQLIVGARTDSGLVGELRPLRYPDDVVPVIRRWFAEHPAWGDDLIAEIAQRPGLQEAATVPLILAFYCIIGGDQKLPEYRRYLYAKVVNRMVTGRWRGSDNGNPDPGACVRTLRAWAWSGATSHSLSGLGSWPDEISTEYHRSDHASGDALDHVAAPLGRPDVDTGTTLRRFVHRSIREHLVAEHVASISVDQAVDALLPHLWFDSDWEYSAAASIVMHPQRDELLQRLICRAAGSHEMPADLSRVDAGWEFRGLLCRVAAQSNENDWSPEVASLISRSMLELAQSGFAYDLRGIAHWEAVSHHAREILLRLLPSQSYPWEASALTEALVQLRPSAEDARRARQALLRMLPLSLGTPFVAKALVQLGASAKDMSRVFRAQLGLLAEQRNRYRAANLVEELIELGVSAEDRGQVREVLLALLASGHGSGTPGQAVKRLVQLAPSAEEKGEAREALLEILASGTASWDAGELVGGLIQLDASAEDKRRAREGLLKLLSDTRPSRANRLVRALVQLDPPADEMHPAHEALVSLLSQPGYWNEVPELTEGLVQLGASAEDRDRAREALLRLLLSQTDRRNAGLLVRGLIQLDPSAEDRLQARGALLRLLPDWNDHEAAARLVTRLGSTVVGVTELREYVGGLVLLDPPAEGKRQFREVLLRLLASHTESWQDHIFIGERAAAGAAALIQGLVELDPSMEDKRQARKALLRLLTDLTGSDGAAQLIRGLVELGPSSDDRRQARGALLRLLASQTDLYEAGQLAEGLLSLDPSPGDQRQARGALLRLLASQTDPYQAGQLAETLLSLDPSPEDQRQAREALLKLLTSQIDLDQAPPLVVRLLRLNVTASEIGTCRDWGTPPTRTLLAAARRNSTLGDWLALLPKLPASIP
jgi:hypothetical protein